MAIRYITLGYGINNERGYYNRTRFASADESDVGSLKSAIKQCLAKDFEGRDNVMIDEVVEKVESMMAESGFLAGEITERQKEKSHYLFTVTNGTLYKRETLSYLLGHTLIPAPKRSIKDDMKSGPVNYHGNITAIDESGAYLYDEADIVSREMREFRVASRYYMSREFY